LSDTERTLPQAGESRGLRALEPEGGGAAGDAAHRRKRPVSRIGDQTIGRRVPREQANSPSAVARKLETEDFMQRASPSNASSVLFILSFFAAFALVMFRFA
jgi:hypothetical protein